MRVETALVSTVVAFASSRTARADMTCGTSASLNTRLAWKAHIACAATPVRKTSVGRTASVGIREAGRLGAGAASIRRVEETTKCGGFKRNPLSGLGRSSPSELPWEASGPVELGGDPLPPTRVEAPK
ncbi:hypothetical protein CH63R_08576 [Colletotrichum higginsianum IMI 349063]|nr:hypothetical protein CH63R_08576 [Colletotrichum higginsianum IMI 349063]OBR07055.1 hypothetical protein CH63R_08576 [Colletotrichum higginsianum IMI 349063]